MDLADILLSEGPVDKIDSYFASRQIKSANAKGEKSWDQKLAGKGKHKLSGKLKVRT